MSYSYRHPARAFVLVLLALVAHECFHDKPRRTQRRLAHLYEIVVDAWNRPGAGLPTTPPPPSARPR